MVINMTAQNYCVVDEQTGVCDNIVLWDGDTQTWTPPPQHLALVQATTPAKIWELNQDNTEYVLTVVDGVGDIGFTWDGEFLVTNEEKPPAPAPQPVVTGAQTL